MGLLKDKQAVLGSKILRGRELTQELYRKNVELAHTNQILSLLRTVDNLVLETGNAIDDLAQGIAEALVQDSVYLLSAIFVRSQDSPAGVFSLGGFDINDGYNSNVPILHNFKNIHMYTDSAWFSDNTSIKTIDITEEGSAILPQLFRGDAVNAGTNFINLGCSTVCLVKLVARKRLVGVLLVGLSMPAAVMDKKEFEFLGRIGETAGIAIDNKLLFEENQNVLKKLQLSNKKLKELDEAKDEFISMASHQLRTPLTSVKGYVSMVLDGDAGKISAQQRELLEQAFASSQRMVYLISDLLNVSRLKTGKFVVEPVPVHMDDIVESEVSQLKETAKARNIELSFNKPENFPVISIDETKTRQVIMNFIDNAIYYTKPGGHIRVELTADDKKIEYKVIDDGLGVPKAEQQHLFTKFYRAANARRARPDGTGLGLFMAKKVVVAQGGSIIFESQEGMGSTFGFTFPLSTVLTK